jgi:hypothetical protein
MTGNKENGVIPATAKSQERLYQKEFFESGLEEIEICQAKMRRRRLHFQKIPWGKSQSQRGRNE